MGAGVTSSELVLDVPQGLAVILARKQPGRRSQLWRMTSAAMLEHEGTSEPRDPRRPVAQRQSLVLDIDAMAPQPDSYARLMLRKPDERRRRTQTWSFTEDGRLCCPALPGLFVQVRSDIMRQGADVLLGRRQPVTSGLNARGIPIEQAIGRQKLRPGSGCLAVAIVASGPTRVLQVTDRMHNRLVSRPMSDWIIIQEHKLIEMDSPDADNKPQVAPRRDLEVHVVLSQGLGVSLVNHFSEELCYIHLTDIDCEYTINSAKETLNCSIRHIQVDNQLLGSQEPVLLHMTPNPRKDMQQCLPALYITACKIPSQERVNADIFEYLIMSIQPISLKIEERVLWKLLQFFGWYQSDPELVKPEESDYDAHRSLTMATSVHSKRYYFGMLLLDARQLRLSVLTSSKLPADLYAIKQLAGIPLIGFRDADIELARFQRGHQFETSSFLLGAIVKHYTESLQSQAAAILGSVDFLGNPLGLFNDVTEGLSGLISEGNVGGLLKNVAHGVSNSTARFTGSLSDTLGKVSMDDRHQEMREEIRAHSGSSGAHLKAGLKGLGIGVVGGLTSVFMQPIEGAARDGVGGLFTGLGKGLVGVVTKPTVGLLDMASGTAHAISKGSRSNSRQEFQRVRPTRCCSGVGGLLQCYSQAQAEDQLFLYSLNRNNYREMLVAYEQTGVAQQIHCLISSENVYFLCGPRQHKNIFLLVRMSELQQCNHRSEGCGTGSLSKKPNVQQLVDVGHPAHNQQSPAVECASGAVASKIAHKINYAKNLYQERMQTLMTDEGPDDAW
ncbi:PREDICTED: vacuolar protein sorting-associated protein 13D-like [Priapulus caudatus]|uniref:Vacuolar protein sorting-associated protein 13D-like n=1 Tax=Priapulus caudatus TaxID=37621 RepID=A0ABM1E0Z2_PRICU|nr:PREDICTED: vacuolar protein sorting-associated protein 13D-like [Priapulus caudatus]